MSSYPLSSCAPAARGRRARRSLGGVLGALVLLVAAGLSVAGPVGGQEPAVLEGIVTEAGTEQPIRGARVTVVELDRVGLTDRGGAFRFASVPAGSYTIRVEAMGYGPFEEPVETGGELAALAVELTRQALVLPEVVATGTPFRGVAPYQPSQALTSEELRVRSADSFGQMLDGEPGLSMRSFGPATGRPVIRGLDGDRVAVLENGQRMGDMSETAHDHGIAMEPLTADRVEVVRGPASLLYGSSALGGVVNLLRRDIPAEWTPGVSGEGAAQFATVNRLVAGAGSAEYGADHWAAGGRVSFRDGSDFRVPGSEEGVLGGTYNRLVTGGAGIGWQGEAVRGGFAVDLHDQVFGIPEEIDDPDEHIEIRSERQRLSGLAEWRRPEGFVQSLELRTAAARFFQREVEVERAPDGSVEEEIPHEFTRTTMDVGLTAVHGAIGPFREGAVGLAFLGSALAARGIEEFHPDGRSLAAAIFAFEQAPLGDRVALQLGARIEHGRIDAYENAVFPDFSARRNATTVSGAVGLGVRPADRLEIGMQVARAHRAPLLEQLYSDGPHIGAGRFEIGNPALRNEIGHGFDLFARYATERLHTEVALFHNGIDDFVFPRNTGESDPESGLPVVVWTAEPASFTGGEAVVEALVSRAVKLRATLDYVRGVQRDDARTPLPFIPPLRGSLEAKYDTGGWWLGARTRSAARQDRVPPTQEPTGGHTLVDLQAGIRLGGPEGHLLVLRMDNALDAIYRDHLSRVDERRYPMPGRNLSLVYRWSF